MTHRRGEIKTAIFNSINGKTSVTNVFINKALPTSEDDLPCILIRTAGETAELFDNSPRVYKRTFTIEIETIVNEKENDQVETLLDNIAAEIEDLLGPDETLGGILEDLVLKSTEYAFNNEGRFLQGHSLITYEADYTSEVNYPVISDDYTGSDTAFKIKDSDASTDENQVEI